MHNKVKIETSVILLAGGRGTRMKRGIPKQFMLLKEKPIARYSFDLFLSIPEINEIMVVCDVQYRHLFEQAFSAKATPHCILSFTDPGKERQDSVFNGFCALKKNPQLICIHDSARPLLTKPLIQRVLDAAAQHGAAAAGMPIKYTIKEGSSEQFVKHTLDRSLIWEIQTPQVVRKDLLQQGFAHIQKEKIQVTDDVSIVELLNHPVKLVEGSYQNVKITTPEDFAIALAFLQMTKEKTKKE